MAFEIGDGESVVHMEQEILLELRDVCFSYDEGKETLKKINLQIKKGARIALAGPNGAGKSTLFLQMNGVLTPDAGSIFCKGEQIHRKNKNLLRQTVGIVFQEADDQIIASTVQGEVSFGPMNLRLPIEEVEARTAQAMDYMNLTAMKNRPPHYLSGGEKKRVSIADVLAMKSEVILMDEPMAALDGVNQTMLEQVLDELWQEGKTFLVSTHDMDFAYRFADWMVIFYEGEILCQGAPEQIFLDEKLLSQANLKKPAMLAVTQLLQEKKLLPEGVFPRTPEQLKEVLERM